MSYVLIAAIATALLVAGVALGRYYVPDTRPLKRAAKEGAMYIRGLNHVLAHDTDAAIAELSKAVSENTGTVDTYFALGVLFRERGEHERAVRVHQSILVRADSSRQLRLEARYQLGLDFEAAGYRRRARKGFEQVLEQEPKHLQAARKLLALYEADQDWEHATKALRRVEKIQKNKDPVRESHLLAEQGLSALKAGEPDRARNHLRRALKANPEGVHPQHAYAWYLHQEGKHRAAARIWLETLQAAPDLADFFFRHLESAYYELGRLHELANRLDGLLAQHPHNPHLRMVQARFIGKQDPQLAMGLIRGVLQEAPSLLPARRILGRIVLEGADEETIRREFQALLETLERIEKSYRCARCGYTGRELFWRCPRCHAWDSVRVAWGRRSGEGQRPPDAVRPAIPGGPRERRERPRRRAT
jgi:lipopolysaccharide biosynthesis regulator YciM